MLEPLLLIDDFEELLDEPATAELLLELFELLEQDDPVSSELKL